MKATLLRIGIAATAAFAAASGTAWSADAAPRMTTTSVLDTCATALAGQPRTALHGCLDTELKTARRQMDGAYAQVESDLRKIDSASTPEALRTLKHSQDSFKSFLQKECRRQGAALMGGTGAGDTEQACQVALTRWRTAQLLEQ
ncbi:lysozyme inhibitor LprI family protein [Bordetella genomosp. 8]|nr:lysozyme inhibitor LprI family protein [Bordetella genomosp. 8]